MNYTFKKIDAIGIDPRLSGTSLLSLVFLACEFADVGLRGWPGDEYYIGVILRILSGYGTYEETLADMPGERLLGLRELLTINMKLPWLRNHHPVIGEGFALDFTQHGPTESVEHRWSLLSDYSYKGRVLEPGACFASTFSTPVQSGYFELMIDHTMSPDIFKKPLSLQA